jgi:hypothetical protein
MENYRSATDDQILSNILGSEGIKTDVKISLSWSAVPLIVASLVVAIVIGNLASDGLMKLLK